MVTRRNHNPVTADNFLTIDDLDKIPIPPASCRDPYGKWTCKDGCEVLFDRGYCPIYSRRPREPAKVADPHEFVDDTVKSEHYWLDGRTQPERSWKTQRKLDQLLREWGVR
jgi:hypothetical protein